MIVEADRVMAFVSQIDEIKTIEKCDNLVLVILKCKFSSLINIKAIDLNVGDYCIFITEGSVLETGEVVKKKKMRGVISHGLIIPLIEGVPKEERYDCTNILSIKKFVKGCEKSQYKNDNIPYPYHLVPKTDEVRIQTDIELISKLSDFVITRKEDGSSATYLFSDRFYICSRNYEVSYDIKSIYVEVCDKFNMKKICEENVGFAFQGEIVGPKINKNKLNLTDIDFKIFNVYDIENKRYLIWNDVIELCDRLKLNTVPTIEHNFDKNSITIENLIKLSNKEMYSEKQHAEGIVVKEKDNSISFKVLSENY